MAEEKKVEQVQVDSAHSDAQAQESALAALKSDMLKEITSRFSMFEEKLISKLAQTPKPAEESNPVGRPKAPVAKDPEFVALQKKIESIEAEKAKLESEKRDTNLRSHLTEQLKKIGIDQRFMKAAIATLVDGDKVVQYTKDEYAADKDKVVFRSADGEEELLAGIRNWAAGEGKSFIAPKGAVGSGDRSYSGGNSGHAVDSKQALVSALMKIRNG